MNVAPGDLAILVGAQHDNGSTCEVLYYGGQDQAIGHYWSCRFSRPVKSVDGYGHMKMLSVVYVPDAWLRRISGPPAPESVETDNPVTKELTK